MAQIDKPFTEQSNDVTYDLDIASTADMVKLIHAADQEVFKGWKESKGLRDEHLFETMGKLKEEMLKVLQNPSESLVVLSGCGTSGRLAFMTARTFNNQLKDHNIMPFYDYTIAGYDIALFKSQEAPEDNPLVGIEMLKEVTRGKKKVLFIGITCGLSAPYVAGQLDYAMNHLDIFTPVLLGFNPVNLARNVTIENWDKTFLQVAQRLEYLANEDKGFILNPIIGPEPITGSSRMKSGSATKIILETLFTTAHQQHWHNSSPSFDSLIDTYESVQCAAYSEYENIGKVIAATGYSLQQGGRIIYLATGGLGVLGMLDASECTPTFGSAFDDIRGFIDGGFATLNNKQGDLSKEIQISCEYFMKEIFPTLNNKDVIVYFYDGDKNTETSSVLQKSMAQTIYIHIHIDEHAVHSKSNICIKLPYKKICTLLGKDVGMVMQPLFCELAVKYVCNLVSTGAHTLLGKVYHNYMIDVKVSNNKLYHRAISLIKTFTRCSEDLAEECLLRSIYEVDLVDEQIKSQPTSSHIDVSTFKARVVPIAMMLSLKQGSVEAAAALLNATPVIRTALEACLETV